MNLVVYQCVKVYHIQLEFSNAQDALRTLTTQETSQSAWYGESIIGEKFVLCRLSMSEPLCAILLKNIVQQVNLLKSKVYRNGYVSRLRLSELREKNRKWLTTRNLSSKDQWRIENKLSKESVNITTEGISTQDFTEKVVYHFCLFLLISVPFFDSSVGPFDVLGMINLWI